MMEKVTVKVPVKARDNHGHEYDVIVFRGGMSAGKSRNPETGKLEYTENREWVLRIDGTPGSWYMKTLLERPVTRSSSMALDVGQGWTCLNFSEVLQAAVKTICTATV